MLHIARLTTVHFVVPILLLVLMPLPVRGSDAKGNYVALGFGGRVPVSCGSFGNLKNRVKYPHFSTSTRGFCHGLSSLFLSVGASRPSNSNFGLVRGLRLPIAPSMAKVITP